MNGYSTFTKEIFAAFRANNREGPVHMLNLIRLRDQADYPDGHVASGKEAYNAYSEGSAPAFAKLGGRIVWRGQFEQTVIGPEEENWDICFIAEYPSVESFVEIIRNPEYREAARHRQAAVADSRLIRLAAAESGVTFGGAS